MTDSDQPTAGVALKPCPFCGGTKAVTTSVRDGRKAGCPECYASSGAAFNGRVDQPSAEERATEKWNTRTPASGAVETAMRDAYRALDPDDASNMASYELVDLMVSVARAALTSEPKAEWEIKGWFWRVRGVKGHFRSEGPVRPSFSSGQPGEVYDLQPIYPDDAPQPVQRGEEDSLEKALEDAREVGIGVLVDGKRLAAGRVTICHGTRQSQRGEVTREAVARVIDPVAFMFQPNDLGLKTPSHRETAFAKADAVLALTSPAQREGDGS